MGNCTKTKQILNTYIIVNNVIINNCSMMVLKCILSHFVGMLLYYKNKTDLK